MAIPKAPIKRIIHEEGAERVSAEAVDALVEFLEAEAEAVSENAVTYAKYAKRKTVKAEDISLATEFQKLLLLIIKSLFWMLSKRYLTPLQKEKALKISLNHL